MIDFVLMIIIAFVLTFVVVKITSLNKYVTFIIIAIAIYFLYTRTLFGNKIRNIVI